MKHAAAEGRMSGIYPNYSGSGIAGWSNGYLTIIPRARMGSESAEWAIDSAAMRARGIIVLVKSS